jgi:cell shape-determining protein MreC
MRLPSKATTFWILMAASAVSAFLLPVAWTTWVRGFFQPLALLQMPMSWFAHASGQGVERLTAGTLPGEDADVLREENEALKRQVAQQRLRLAEAQQRIDELTRLSSQLRDSQIRIVIAPVVAYDANPRRATLRILLNERQHRLIEVGQWVAAAGAPTPDWDSEATVRDLLDREWLIGRVQELYPRVAVVQLTTDALFRCEVRTARVLADGTWQLAPESSVLVGLGNDEMQIPQAVEDFFKLEHRIVVVPASRDLPVSMSLGRIVSSVTRKDSAQHFDLRVVPWQRLGNLTHVYVIASEP